MRDKHKEIGPRLKELDCAFVALLETKVKSNNNAGKTRSKLGRYSVVDNYSSHDNGRILILWDVRKIAFKISQGSAQFIHGSIHTLGYYCLCFKPDRTEEKVVARDSITSGR